MSLRIVVADDQAMVRAGFRSLLNEEPDLEVVGEAADGEQAVAAVRRFRPDVALMDIRMPTVDGLEATRRIVAGGLATRILILTTFDLDEYVYEGLRAGASGFLLKDASPEQLIAAIHVVAEGEAVLAPTVTRRVVEAFARIPAADDALRGALESLTAREREVLRLLARGRSNAEIARELFVSEATAKTHVRHVLSKLDLRDRVQAVVFAYESGLVARGETGTERGSSI
jgi:DNA-binding NarL/FixJ family response regulator